MNNTDQKTDVDSIQHLMVAMKAFFARPPNEEGLKKSTTGEITNEVSSRDRISKLKVSPPITATSSQGASREVILFILGEGNVGGSSKSLSSSSFKDSKRGRDRASCERKVQTFFSDLFSG